MYLKKNSSKNVFMVRPKTKMKVLMGWYGSAYPNKVFSLTQLELGFYDAVSNLNIGRKASVLLFKKLNMIPGIYTLQGCSIMNKSAYILQNTKIG